MQDATQNYDQILDDERLFGWQSALFPTGRSGMYKIETGRYRDGVMQVVSGAMGKERVHYQAPSPEIESLLWDVVARERTPRNFEINPLRFALDALNNYWYPTRETSQVLSLQKILLKSLG